MLPIIEEEMFNSVMQEAFQDISAWHKKMIHYIKEENPEINSAIIEIVQKTGYDPKAVATGAYITYLLLEHASINMNDSIIEDIEE